MQTPIYILIYEQLYGSYPQDMYGLPRVILSVIACDLANIEEVYNSRVAPLQAAGRRVQVLYFSREPDSILRERSEQMFLEG